MEVEEQLPQSVPPQEPAASRPAGFWRRFWAFLIDYATINTLAGVVSTVFPWLLGRYTTTFLFSAFFVAVLYWVAMSGWPENGQSIGMAALKLRVVNSAGGPVTRRQAVIRSTILAACSMLPTLMLLGPPVPLVLRMLFDCVVNLCRISLIYLVIFNRQSRQSVHDMLAGCYVVHAKSAGPVSNTRVSPTHWAVMPAICLAVAALFLPIAPTLIGVSAAVDDLRSIQGASPIGFRYWYGFNGDTVCSVVMTLDNNVDPAEVIGSVAQTTLRRPEVTSCDYLNITVVQPEFDFWLMGSRRVWCSAASTSEWCNGARTATVVYDEMRIGLLSLYYLR